MELASLVSAVSLAGLFLHPPQLVSPEDASVPQCWMATHSWSPKPFFCGHVESPYVGSVQPAMYVLVAVGFGPQQRVSRQ